MARVLVPACCSVTMPVVLLPVVIAFSISILSALMVMFPPAVVIDPPMPELISKLPSAPVEIVIFPVPKFRTLAPFEKSLSIKT